MADLSQALNELEKVVKARASSGFKLFEPYPLQDEFVRQTSVTDNLCLSGANRTGKTSLAGRYLLPVWLTGDYPEYWNGRKFGRPIVAWVGSTDWTTNIDGCQRALLGDVHRGKESAGIGYPDADGKIVPPGIPRDAIHKIEMNPHVKGAVSRVFIKHKSGGLSEIRFISYLQGRERLQAGKVDVVWMDEEPPQEIATELSARTIDSKGLSILTFTPLKGLSAVVLSFIGDSKIDVNLPSVLTSSRGVLVRMSVYDVPHLADDPEKIESMKRRYPQHEHLARIDGIPAIGEGAIYPFNDADISIQNFQPENHFLVLDAVDFGFNHPTARARVFLNPVNGHVIVSHTYKASGQSPSQHMSAWEREFPQYVDVAWPHDGRNTETDGKTKLKRYTDLGMLALNKSVTMPGFKGGLAMPFEGSVQLLYEMFQAGTLKVVSSNHHFFSEKALYRREKKGGQEGPYAIPIVVKENDDVLDAVRYAVCQILVQFEKGQGRTWRMAKQKGTRKIVYDRSDHSGDNSGDDWNPFEFI